VLGEHRHRGIVELGQDRLHLALGQLPGGIGRRRLRQLTQSSSHRGQFRRRPSGH
jgi:hypothetical protein